LFIFLRRLCELSLVAAVIVSAAAQSGRTGSVERLYVISQNPFQIQIQASHGSQPQVQLVSNPERLVVDIPNSIPGAGLRGLAINRGDVRGVRVSLYSAKPPITRVVVDLNAPEWYRVVPNASGLAVMLGGDGESAQNTQPVIGWVSARVESAHAGPIVLRKAPATRVQPVNGVSVFFDRGLLTIHAANATLSEVLFQIHQQTGVEIAIPSGTEQERVASDFGPGTPRQVLEQLLNGTDLNFVAVGSASDPNQLRSVVLSRKTGEPDPPSAFLPAESAAAPTAPVTDPQNYEPPPQELQENGPPPPQEGGSQQMPPPAGPPANPVPQ
jgi:AMIN domain